MALGNFDPKANVQALPVKFGVDPFYQGGGSWANLPFGNVKGHLMKNFGCTLTALAMALNYNGVPCDPGEIDYLLMGNTGGLSPVTVNPETGQPGGNDLNWGPATYLAAQTSGQGSISWNGVFDYMTPQGLRDLLTSTSEPVIVKVANPDTGHDHYVLVTGIDDNTFWINDPGYMSKNTLDEYLDSPDEFIDVVGYVGDPPGDLSGLYLTSTSASATPTLTVTDPDGRTTSISTAGQILNQIPNAIVFEEGPQDLSGADPGTAI